MAGRNVLSLKFAGQAAVVCGQLDRFCSPQPGSAPLCDAEIVCAEQSKVFLHSLVLARAFPLVQQILRDPT